MSCVGRWIDVMSCDDALLTHTWGSGSDWTRHILLYVYVGGYVCLLAMTTRIRPFSR